MHNDCVIYVLSSAASFIEGMVVFVLSNVFFAFVDLTGMPAFLLKYKIQEEKSVPVSNVIRSHCSIIVCNQQCVKEGSYY